MSEILSESIENGPDPWASLERLPSYQSFKRFEGAGSEKQTPEAPDSDRERQERLIIADAHGKSEKINSEILANESVHEKLLAAIKPVYKSQEKALNSKQKNHQQPIPIKHLKLTEPSEQDLCRIIADTIFDIIDLDKKYRPDLTFSAPTDKPSKPITMWSGNRKVEHLEIRQSEDGYDVDKLLNELISKCFEIYQLSSALEYQSNQLLGTKPDNSTQKAYYQIYSDEEIEYDDSCLPKSIETFSKEVLPTIQHLIEEGATTQEKHKQRESKKFHKIKRETPPFSFPFRSLRNEAAISTSEEITSTFNSSFERLAWGTINNLSGNEIRQVLGPFNIPYLKMKPGERFNLLKSFAEKNQSNWSEEFAILYYSMAKEDFRRPFMIEDAKWKAQLFRGAFSPNKKRHDEMVQSIRSIYKQNEAVFQQEPTDGAEIFNSDGEKICQLFMNKFFDALGIKAEHRPTLRFESMPQAIETTSEKPFQAAGVFHKEDNSIVIYRPNQDQFRSSKYNIKKMLKFLAHECFHVYQEYSSNQWSPGTFDGLPGQTAETKIDTILHRANLLGYQNYIHPRNDYEGYHNQGIEISANIFAGIVEEIIRHLIEEGTTKEPPFNISRILRALKKAS